MITKTKYVNAFQNMYATYNVINIGFVLNTIKKNNKSYENEYILSFKVIGIIYNIRFIKLKLISDMPPQTLKRPTEDVYSSGTYIVQSKKSLLFPRNMFILELFSLSII